MRRRQSITPKNQKKPYANNVIDFSKKKRDMSHIISNKPTKKKIINFDGVKVIKVVSVFFLLLVVALSIHIFLNSNHATIQSLSLDGNFLLDEQEILDHLPKVGQANFFSTGNDHFEDSIKELKWIKEIHVDRNFLARTIDVSIVERRPLYKIMRNNETQIIDEEGEVLPNLSSIVGLSVPIVIGQESANSFPELAETLKHLPNHFLHAVAEVNIESPNSIYLYTLDNFTIQIGEFRNLTEEKAEEIIQIMNIQKNQNQKGTIDIRGRNIIFKPVEG